MHTKSNIQDILNRNHQMLKSLSKISNSGVHGLKPTEIKIEKKEEKKTPKN